jgi:hypothetical protein
MWRLKMKYAGHITIAILVLYISCTQNEEPGETLLCYQGVVEFEDYWWAVFITDSGMIIEMEFLSDQNVDVLLMDSEGFIGFKRRIGYEGLAHKEWYLEMEEFGTCTLDVQIQDSLHMAAYIPYMDSMWNPIDVYLFNSVQYDLYLQGQEAYGYENHYYTTWVEFNFSPFLIETLYLVLDNTSTHGTPPEGPDLYWADICKYMALPFDYYGSGSALDTDSIHILYDVLYTGKYYLVVNNAGYVENGAIPEGDASFSIDITTY